MNPHQDGRANPVLIARPQKFFYRKDIHNELIFDVIAYYTCPWFDEQYWFFFTDL
jgi:hypothetical protein